ncbi:ABC-type transport system involved in cytochrome bd biosynthesis [Commensalibacter communis]|uniref:thiol reductant ABC exporter subunit CydD n=1 Tax=Commensalibacter communis TaxID=2972786 RepID=UPI0022FFA57B|nr:thiol reductant ABC exporter subunit CydD [Commensalibacter communis]CAI3948525.1 ABC-type transport system involved in cytochrome bd biosynthesis [Commensalibacter communis]CAI3949880.1 ABC-type transport system involved in cytochrome bd biosynthesis [Commensalibacter communis]
MQNNKAQIKIWTKLQTKTGKRSVFPMVILGIFSSFIAVGLACCIAQILGMLLVPSLSQSIGFSPFMLLISFVFLFLLKGLIVYSEDLIATKIGLKARHRLRSEFIQHIMQIGPSILYRQSGGGLASLVVDQVEALDGYFSRWLPASILWFVSPCIILICIFLVQPWAALIIGICGLMVPIAQAIFGIGAAVAARQQFLAMTRLQARFLDRIQGIATIVLAGRAEDEAKKIAESANELRIRTMKVLRVAFLSSASIDCAMIIAILLVALMDVQHFTSVGGEHTIPVVHALFALLIIPDFFAPLRSLALAYQDRAKLAGAAASVVELPEVPEKSESNHIFNENNSIHITFNKVSYIWDEKRGNAIENISFEVAPNSTAILIGASGAGKSTIISMLLGFIEPTSGQILFNGVDLTTIKHESVSALTAWIGQKPVIFSGTIRENILFAKPNATETELKKAVQGAAIDQYLSALPNGLDTMIGEGGYGLSGGQAQRVAIARAYLKDAPLLFLDEPTAHLDPVTEQDIFTSLIQLSQNRTVILATHSALGQRLQGKHIQLDHGRIIAETEVE